MSSPDPLAALDRALAALDLPQRLAALRAAVPGRLVFTTSFGLEDQALTHALVASGIEVEIATLDTGRLFPETEQVWAETEARYGLRVRAFHPETAAVEALLAAQGIGGFRASLENRQACCHVRKVAPLGRALAGAGGWLTGLRRGQSALRGGLAFVTRDPAHGVVKANPLIDWERQAVEAYVARYEVPVSALHARGFPSIGCAPCTRAVAPGEDERAGRWWWEQEDKKECGLHVGPDGRLVRSAA